MKDDVTLSEIIGSLFLYIGAAAILEFSLRFMLYGMIKIVLRLFN